MYGCKLIRVLSTDRVERPLKISNTCEMKTTVEPYGSGLFGGGPGTSRIRQQGLRVGPGHDVGLDLLETDVGGSGGNVCLWVDGRAVVGPNCIDWLGQVLKAGPPGPGACASSPFLPSFLIKGIILLAERTNRVTRLGSGGFIPRLNSLDKTFGL